MNRRLALLLSTLPLLLAGCDMLGIETGTVVAAKKEAEGKAIGGACRHAMRAIEDCYTLNPKAQKAAIYTGWREMDEYLRETKSEGIVPVIPRKPARAAPVPGAEGAASDTAGGGVEDRAQGQDGEKSHDNPPAAAERTRAKRAASTH